MKNPARKDIAKLRPYTCARDLYKEGVLLDANENYRQWVKIDWSKITDLNRYFDSTAEQLREKLVDKYIKGFDKENIFVGCGSDEAIDLIIRSFVEDNEYIMVMDPSYPLYQIQAEANGIKTKVVQLTPDFNLNVSKIKDNINKVKIIFLCSPNNPTGSLIRRDDVTKMLEFFDGLVVIDEAYIEFTDSNNSFIDLVKTNPQVIILRTFSKAWGLAGIRLGYAITQPETISSMLKVKDSYNTAALSQKVALQALDQIDGLQKSVAELKKLKSDLEQSFKKIGLETISNDTNFVLLKIANASTVSNKLAEKGIIIRDKSNETYLENIIRITVGSEDENGLLIKAIKDLL